jgi:hypothetical protein
MATGRVQKDANGATISQLEQRVRTLELAVGELSRAVRSSSARVSGPNPTWYIEEAGRFANDPVFDEIVRLGREYRESLRPKPRKALKKPSKPSRRKAGRVGA